MLSGSRFICRNNYQLPIKYRGKLSKQGSFRRDYALLLLSFYLFSLALYDRVARYVYTHSRRIQLFNIIISAEQARLAPRTKIEPQKYLGREGTTNVSAIRVNRMRALRDAAR